MIEKSIDFYKEKNDNFLFEQVNVEAFLESLKEHADEMTESAFMEKEERKINSLKLKPNNILKIL